MAQSDLQKFSMLKKYSLHNNNFVSGDVQEIKKKW